MPDTPQFSLPLSLTPDGTSFNVIEQASNGELAQRVDVLCRTPIGYLDGRPDFGLAEQAHLEGGADTQEVERQLAQHIPEAEVLVEEDLSALNAGLDYIGVQVGGR